MRKRYLFLFLKHVSVVRGIPGAGVTLPAVVRFPTWVQGTETWSSTKSIRVLNHWALSIPNTWKFSLSSLFSWTDCFTDCSFTDWHYLFKVFFSFPLFTYLFCVLLLMYTCQHLGRSQRIIWFCSSTNGSNGSKSGWQVPFPAEPSSGPGDNILIS